MSCSWAQAIPPARFASKSSSCATATPTHTSTLNAIPRYRTCLTIFTSPPVRYPWSFAGENSFFATPQTSSLRTAWASTKLLTRARYAILWLSAQVLQDWLQPSTARRKGLQFWYWKRTHRVDKPVRVRASKTTWDSRREYPARNLPVALIRRHKSSARRCLSRVERDSPVTASHMSLKLTTGQGFRPA